MPHVGPTSCSLMSVTVMPACVGEGALQQRVASVAIAVSVCGADRDLRPRSRSATSASGLPSVGAGSRCTSSAVIRLSRRCTSSSAPPLKSIDKLKPAATRPPISDSTITMPESANQSRLRSTIRKCGTRVAAVRRDRVLEVHGAPPPAGASDLAGLGLAGDAARRGPNPCRFTSRSLRAIRNTVGRLKNQTTNRSSSVATPSVSANPRTELDRRHVQDARREHRHEVGRHDRLVRALERRLHGRARASCRRAPRPSAVRRTRCRSRR